jgi:hypothetical protein
VLAAGAVAAAVGVLLGWPSQQLLQVQQPWCLPVLSPQLHCWCHLHGGWQLLLLLLLVLLSLIGSQAFQQKQQCQLLPLQQTLHPVGQRVLLPAAVAGAAMVVAAGIRLQLLSCPQPHPTAVPPAAAAACRPDASAAAG